MVDSVRNSSHLKNLLLFDCFSKSGTSFTIRPRNPPPRYLPKRVENRDSDTYTLTCVRKVQFAIARCGNNPDVPQWTCG